MAQVQVERLSKELCVCVSGRHKFGTDAFLLADFAAPKRKELVCDLGTGCGIIPMIFCKRFQPDTVYGVDIQPEAIALFQQGIHRSSTDTKLVPVLADLTCLPEQMPSGRFDLVCCNPPYFQSGTGLLSQNLSDQIARHETNCTVEQICTAASRLLRYGGRFCLCHKPERLVEVLGSMRQAGLEPKRLRLVAKNSLKPPWLVLVEGKRGAQPSLQVLPTLEVYAGQDFSREMKQIVGWGEQNER